MDRDREFHWSDVIVWALLYGLGTFTGTLLC